MTRCFEPCRCNLTLKVFLTAITLYLIISCSLMLPSIQDYSNFKNMFQEIDQTQANQFECQQICNLVYRFFKEPSLCCSDGISQCFTKVECKVSKLDYLKNQQDSALFDIKMGLSITVFSLIVLTIIFKKKNAALARQEAFQRQNLMNFQENIRQANINATFLLKNDTMSVYKSFIENEKSQQSLCAICYQQFFEEKVIKLNCTHKFHGDCIRQWLKKKNDCPVCRAQA